MQILSKYDFLVLVGQKIKILREKNHFTQEYLCMSICDSTFLSKLENGKLRKVDINILIKITNKLGVNLNEILEKILIDINIDYHIIETVFRFVSDCDFNELDCYMDSLRKNHYSNSKIDLYVNCSKLYYAKKYQEIISILEKYIHMDELLSIIDVLITNIYILCFETLSFDNYIELKKIEPLVIRLYESVMFYTEFYPKIMIRIKINLIDYYRLTNVFTLCYQIIDEAYKSCYELELFDSLIDIVLNQIVLALQTQQIDEINTYFQQIEAYFILIDKPFKKIILKEKFLSLQSIYKKYYL